MNNTINKNIFVFGIVLILIINFLIPVVGSLNINNNIVKSIENQLYSEKQFNTFDGSFADLWDVTLEFNEPGGSYDNVFLGEKTDASDGPDAYDVPKLPYSFPPYIRSWFQTNFPEPNDELWKEYKHGPDFNKTWNLTIQWVPSDYSSPTTLTISWNNVSFVNSEYFSIILYDINNNVIVSDMMVNSSYIFTCSAITLQIFQIICTANQPPIANDDTDTVFEDSINNQIDVLGNDNDPNGDNLTITSITQPSNGTAIHDNDYVYYTPNPNYNGLDSFTYIIHDGEGGTDSATINITVNPINDPPNVPTNPIPINGATDIDINVDLSWSCSDPDNDNLTYDVYFGTISPPPLISNNQTSTNYDPGVLNYTVQYYWQIVAWDPYGEFNTSPIWYFTTTNKPNDPPNIPYNPYPINGATDIAININISWNCSDPDGDNLTYDIYFGYITPPPLISTGQLNTSYYPGILDFDTIYYWKIKVWDNHSASNESPIWNFTTRNNTPPDIPAKPSGPTEGKTGIEIEYSTKTNDTDGDQIYYWFDWGNGYNSGWIGPYESNITIYKSYTYTDSGDYEIKVKAMDNFNQESDWSEALNIKITQQGSLEVVMITGGFFRVSALIKNVASEEITNVNWSIGLAAGLILTGFITTGTIDHIPPGGVVAVYSDPIIGFGVTRITASAETDGSIPDIKDTGALMLVIYNWILSY
jgi:hypothetical protein